MKKVLITGGTGSVAEAFIQNYSDRYVFYNYSRDEKRIYELNKKFSNVVSIIGDITDLPSLIRTLTQIKPDIIIHAAALKHADMGESNQTEFIKTNVIGSYNLIQAAVIVDIKTIIGISTDKASCPKNIYGYTKKLMEQMFLDAYTQKNKFICTRFANVAGSSGSVIPFWKSLISEGKKIKLTDPRMHRLMISQKECAELINKAIDLSHETDYSFILSKRMKSVSLLSLAKTMSNNDIEIVGKRPGEQLHEILVSNDELSKTSVYEKDYFIIRDTEIGIGTDRLPYEYSSQTAEKASHNEILSLIS